MIISFYDCGIDFYMMKRPKTKVKIFYPLDIQQKIEDEYNRLRADPDSEYFVFEPFKKLQQMRKVFNLTKETNYQFRTASFPEKCLSIPFPIHKKLKKDTYKEYSLFRIEYLTHIQKTNETLDGKKNLNIEITKETPTAENILQYIENCMNIFNILKKRILKNNDLVFFIEAHNILTWIYFLTRNTILKYDEMIDIFAIDTLNFKPKEKDYFKNLKNIENPRFFIVYHLRSKNFKNRLLLYVYVPEKKNDTFTNIENRHPVIYPYNETQKKEPIDITISKETINKFYSDIDIHKFLHEKNIQERQERLQLLVNEYATAKPVEENRSMNVKPNQNQNTFLDRQEKQPYYTVTSVQKIFNSANWSEREIWDFYGINFIDHPDLRRIFTDYTFNDYPLRKDFPLTGYKEIEYDEKKQSFRYLPVELTQDFRIFEHKTPWQV